ELDRQHRRRHHLPRRHQGRLMPTNSNGTHPMLNRFAALAACSLVPLTTAPMAVADPPADDPGAPPDPGGAPPRAPAVVPSPDGWVLTVAAKDETQLPIAPLTT